MKLLAFVCYFTLLPFVAVSVPLEGGIILSSPEGCHENPNFCMSYCKSVGPASVINGVCGTDKTSCICTTDGSGPIKLRIIPEKAPISASMKSELVNSFGVMDPNMQQPFMNPQPQMMPFNPQPAVPQLLVCDNSEGAISICQAFCASIFAFGGVCNTSDLTCICSGVSPSVVQSVPIPAIFTLPDPPAQLAPSMSLEQPWTPIQNAFPQPQQWKPSEFKSSFPHPVQNQNQQQWTPIINSQPLQMPLPAHQSFQVQEQQMMTPEKSLQLQQASLLRKPTVLQPAPESQMKVSQTVSMSSTSSDTQKSRSGEFTVIESVPFEFVSSESKDSQ